MKFIWEDKEINIKTKNPEFLDWKWIDLDQITNVVVSFKLHVYKELKEKVEKIINWDFLKHQFFDQANILIDHWFQVYSHPLQLVWVNLVF